MIDFHTHVLPGMDDGSKDVQESVEMLGKLRNQGIETVMATSHFYANHDTLDRFLQRRAKAVEELKSVYKEEKPEIVLGAEVHYFRGISNSENIEKLVIEGTNILLLELPYGEWDETILMEIEAIKRNLGLQVMIAHIDRYYLLGRNKSYIQQLLNMDVLIQVNIETFLSFRFSKRVLKLLLTGKIDALGSDCHNMSTRKPQWDSFMEYMNKKNAQTALEELCEKNCFMIAGIYEGRI